MLKKLLITLIICLGLGFGISAHAASGSCPTDDGAGTGAGPGQYYCLGAFRSGQAQCPSWTGTTCATGLNCPVNCNGADACGYCNSCTTGNSLCGSYPSQVCTANTTAPTNCTSFNQCSKVCSACAQGYELVGNACNGATLKLGGDSVGAASHIFQSTSPTVSILSSGRVGIGATAPNDVFSIGSGGVAAPAGTADTGHNYTSTYLTTDDYALVNYGVVKTLVGGSSNFWGGAINANIWNGAAGAGNVGIGTTTPAYKLDVNGQLRITGNAFFDAGNFVKDQNSTVDSMWGWYAWDKEFQFNKRTLANVFVQNIFTANWDTGNLALVPTAGSVGVGTASPNDRFSIGSGGVAAPAGSADTGHNYTSTYLTSDNYALVNYGLLKSMVMMAGNATTTVSGGDLNMGGKNILNVNKLTVNTIDPLYNLRGINYSTYAPSISGGVKEECVGKVILTKRNSSDEYEKIIDFAVEPVGSDLWVWHSVIDYNSENVEVLLTPYGKFANTYYLIEGNKLIFRSDKPITLSYRLIGSRFDWRKWPTKALDQTEKGMLVN